MEPGSRKREADREKAMNKFRVCVLPVLWLGIAGMCGLAGAQDTRVVTEPKIPASCVVLKAALVGGASGLAMADEQRADTARLQKALDDCGAGKAVELASDTGSGGAKNAFLTGPLELRAGVTLLVDGGVTLYGSRTPKDYETEAGSCGVVSEGNKGCRPLLSAKHVAGAAIMGDGVIDGRGGSKMIVDGKEQGKTWWDLGEDARKGGHQQNPRLLVADHSDDFTLYRITLKNAGFFHVTYSGGDGFTVWGLKIDTPKNARNTDGVDPGLEQEHHRDAELHPHRR